MTNWLTAVGFWEQQMLRRILKSWRALGGQRLLTALAHWESSQSGLGPAFRWWRRVVLHLRNADHVAQQHRQHHACRAAFQARPVADQLYIGTDVKCLMCTAALVSKTVHVICFSTTHLNMCSHKPKCASSLPCIYGLLSGACLHAALSEPLCRANCLAYSMLIIDIQRLGFGYFCRSGKSVG